MKKFKLTGKAFKAKANEKKKENASMLERQWNKACKKAKRLSKSSIIKEMFPFTFDEVFNMSMPDPWANDCISVLHGGTDVNKHEEGIR